MQRILLADDNLASRRSIEQVLEVAGIDVISVGNGDLALARLGDVRPQMVLLDAVMPGRSGYEICEEIKAHGEFGRLPVLLVTSDFEPYDEERAARAGADGHLVKPLDAHAIATMREVWSRYAPDAFERMPPVNASGDGVASTAAQPAAAEAAPARPAAPVRSGPDAYTTQSVPALVDPDEAAPSEPSRDSAASGEAVAAPSSAHSSGATPPGASDDESGSRGDEGVPPLSQPGRGRSAALPDMAIDAFDGDDDHPLASAGRRTGKTGGLPSAPTTENLDADLARDVETARSADAAGIRSVSSGELRLAAGRCPNCREPLSPGDIFCISCGAPVLLTVAEAALAPSPQGPSCGACGQQVAAGDIFCISCGAVV